MEYAGEDTRIALIKAQGKEILIVVADAAQYMGERAPAAVDKQQPDLPLPDAGERVDADLDTILAGDDSEQPAGQITSLAAEREEALKDPFAAGKGAAAQGFNETRNPFDHPSIESAEWLRGHAEGEQERLAGGATSGKRRRSRTQANGPTSVMSTIATGRTLSRNETHDLGMIIKDRAKVLRAHAEEQAAACLADFEKKLAAVYTFDQDEVWKVATEEALKVVRRMPGNDCETLSTARHPSDLCAADRMTVGKAGARTHWHHGAPNCAGSPRPRLPR